MAEAPKIPRLIRERVRARQAGVRSQAEHPDADLLAAFSENTLTREERSLMLGHLGDCEACREVVMLSGMVPEQDTKSIRLREHPFLSGMGLRWASLAAVFAMTIGVVVMERSSRQSEGFVTQPAPVSEVATPARTASEQEPAIATEKGDRAAVKEQDTKVADARQRGKTAGKPAVPPPTPAQAYAAMRQNSIGRPLAGEAQSRSERAGGRVSLPKDEFSSGSNAIVAKQEMIRNRGQLPVEGTNKFETRGAGVGLGAAQDSSRPPAPESKAYPYAAAPPALPPANATEEDSGASLADSSAPASDPRLARKKSTDQVSPKAAAQPGAARPLSREDKAVTAQAEVITTSEDFNSQGRDNQVALSSGALAVAAPVAARWRIQEGKLQRSSDEGKTWQEVDLEPGVNLHTFWIQGGTVWAGGTGGSLFHLTSQGKNAVRIPIKVSGGDVSQTVVTISFSDEQNGTIKLENGQVLRTTDGGKTWQRF